MMQFRTDSVTLSLCDGYETTVMMTFCRRIGRGAYWLAVLAASIGVWWFVNDRLDPKPVWTIPIEDTLQLTHYQPDMKLLAGIRRKPNVSMDLVVMDAVTGMEKARLTVPDQTVWDNRDYQPIEIGPRLYGDTLVRFTNRPLETGENQVEFRSWNYLRDPDETIVASWRTPSLPVKYNMSLDGTGNFPQEWITTVWSMHDAGLVLVYRYLPTDQMLNQLRRAFTVDLNLGWVEYTRYCSLSIWLCEAWQWEQDAGRFRLINQYTLPLANRALFQSVANAPIGSPLRITWSKDDYYFYLSKAWSQTGPAIKRVEARTGTITSCNPIDTRKQGYTLNITGDLIFSRQDQILDRIESGRLLHQLIRSPHKGSKVNWSINEWRPLLEANTLKKIEWPAELDHCIVGEDLFMADAADSNRYLYHSNVWDDSPYWSKPLHGGADSHFVFMRYHQRKLKIENQWRYDGKGQWRTSALCGQLFVVGQQDLELSEQIQQMLLLVRPLWLLYFERAKINAPYVAEVAIEDGTMRWKKLERELAPIPFLGKDYLLLRCRTAYMSQQAGYECWKLPIEVSSPWWGRLGGLAVFTVLVLCSIFASRKRTLPNVALVQ